MQANQQLTDVERDYEVSVQHARSIHRLKTETDQLVKDMVQHVTADTSKPFSDFLNAYLGYWAVILADMEAAKMLYNIVPALCAAFTKPAEFKAVLEVGSTRLTDFNVDALTPQGVPKAYQEKLAPVVGQLLDVLTKQIEGAGVDEAKYQNMKVKYEAACEKYGRAVTAYELEVFREKMLKQAGQDRQKMLAARRQQLDRIKAERHQLAGRLEELVKAAHDEKSSSSKGSSSSESAGGSLGWGPFRWGGSAGYSRSSSSSSYRNSMLDNSRTQTMVKAHDAELAAAQKQIEAEVNQGNADLVNMDQAKVSEKRALLEAAREDLEAQKTAIRDARKNALKSEVLIVKIGKSGIDTWARVVSQLSDVVLGALQLHNHVLSVKILAKKLINDERLTPTIMLTMLHTVMTIPVMHEMLLTQTANILRAPQFEKHDGLLRSGAAGLLQLDAERARPQLAEARLNRQEANDDLVVNFAW